jgi:hypothetical protein
MVSGCFAVFYITIATGTNLTAINGASIFKKIKNAKMIIWRVQVLAIVLSIIVQLK